MFPTAGRRWFGGLGEDNKATLTVFLSCFERCVPRLIFEGIVVLSQLRRSY